MRILELFTDGGGRRGEDRHYECRDCGRNLPEGAETCPECGGEVAVYTL